MATKLNRETIDALVRAFEMGAHFSVASRYAGVSPGTLKKWLQRSEEKDCPKIFKRLRQALEKASVACEMTSLTTIHNARNNGDVRAATWMLERRFSKRWSKESTTKVNVHGTIEHKLPNLAAAAELPVDVRVAMLSRVMATAPDPSTLLDAVLCEVPPPAALPEVIDI